jgi:hypothetical protein
VTTTRAPLERVIFIAQSWSSAVLEESTRPMNRASKRPRTGVVLAPCHSSRFCVLESRPARLPPRHLQLAT